MSALPRPDPFVGPGPRDGPEPIHGLGELALPFAWSLLREQKVSPLALPTTSRALALLLERSFERPGEPVVLSAQEGARRCSFEPRTWWLVKRRLLSLGHLVASAGGGPPSGRPGGRGHKAAYFVAPATLARFKQTVNGERKTLNGPLETLKALPEERDRSHHRSLRIFKKEKTSDVLSFEETPNERPTIEAIWAQARSEVRVRVKLRLLRLLESLLLAEAIGNLLNATPPRSGNDGVNAAPQTVKDPAKERRPRSGTPLWRPTSTEEVSVSSHARSILEWSNRDFGARFDVDRCMKDMLLYPFEHVRAAVSNVLLKKSRGYGFKNPGAVLWEGITLEGYKLDEFSVARFSEVLARIPDAPATRRVTTSVESPSTRSAFGEARRKRLLLQMIYEKLPEDAREAIDRRAQALAEEELGERGASERLAFRKLEHRNALLEAAHGDAIGACSASQESQNTAFASARDETEPNAAQVSRT